MAHRQRLRQIVRAHKKAIAIGGVASAVLLVGGIVIWRRRRKPAPKIVTPTPDRTTAPESTIPPPPTPKPVPTIPPPPTPKPVPHGQSLPQGYGQ